MPRPLRKNPAFIYALCFAVGIAYWLADGVHDYLTFGDTIRQLIFHEPLQLSDALFFNIPRNDLYTRLGFMGGCLLIALLLHRYINRDNRAMARLQKNEARFRFFAGVASEGILVHDGDRVLHVNRAFADLTGLECAGWPLQELETALLPPFEQNRVREVLAESRRGPVEFSPLPRDSVEFVHLQSQPHTLDGKAVHVVCLRDISTQKNVESRLVRERNLLRTVIDRSEDIIFLTDRVGRFQLANAAMARFFSLESSNDLLGQTLADLLPDEEAAAAAGVDRRILQNGLPEIDFEEIWPTPAGEMKCFSTTKAPVIDERDIPTGIVATMRDVTDRRAREKAELEREAALASSRAKSRFLAHMSHEIRTPLNSVLGACELLHEAELSRSQDELVALLESSGKVLYALVGDILDLSKIESGRMQLEKEDFDLIRLLEETIQPHRTMAREQGLAMSLTLAPDLPHRVLGDPGRLRQVLFNIVGNALKFTREGFVDIRARRDRELHMLRFEIRDSGIGISREQHRLIFQSFTQAHADSTREFSGTGLGLAIARHLVELMDGTIHVRSSPGMGSTFTFTACLPDVPEAQDNDAPAQNETEEHQRTEPVRILLVEDNRNNQLLTRHFLSGPGYTIEVAGNGREALDRFLASAYDVILMDMEMPVMDGYTATRLIRREEAASGASPVPIIALTANAFVEARDRCLDAGCTEYLSKPLSKQKLTEAIEGQLHGAAS